MVAALVHGRKLHVVAILLSQKGFPVGKGLEAASLELEGGVIFEKASVKDFPGAVARHGDRSGLLTS